MSLEQPSELNPKTEEEILEQFSVKEFEDLKDSSEFDSL
jgi:hypothetical protein